jgi:sugar phosphate isomerase/epimerase
MKISTSTNIHQLWGKQSIYPVTESIEKCAAAGFEAIDISLNTASRDGGPVTNDQTWEQWTDGIACTLEKSGLKATQAHALFVSGKDVRSEDYWVQTEKMIRRDIIIAGILGIPWIVMHPLHNAEAVGCTHEQLMEKNVAWFRKFEEEAARNHVGLAIENMFPDAFTTADELIELINHLDNDVIFGLCWDVGHAHVMGQDEYASIMKMGSLLKATHIQDNRGKHDDHLLPGLGDIDWPSVSRALQTSGYQGDFTYEIQEWTRYLPARYHDEALRFAVKVAKDIREEGANNGTVCS